MAKQPKFGKLDGVLKALNPPRRAQRDATRAQARGTPTSLNIEQLGALLGAALSSAPTYDDLLYSALVRRFADPFADPFWTSPPAVGPRGPRWIPGTATPMPLAPGRRSGRSGPF